MTDEEKPVAAVEPAQPSEPPRPLLAPRLLGDDPPDGGVAASTMLPRSMKPPVAYRD
jgi:hypothetical protein